MKYIFTRHWDYWYSVYHVGKYENTDIDEVEFHISNQADRETGVFHFDFYTLNALTRMVENNDFISSGNSEYPKFIEKYNALKMGEIDFFIGSLYYETFNPSLSDCNNAIIENKSILELKSPSYEPYYAVIFINENHSLMPEFLVQWTTKVCRTLFKSEYEFKIADMPTLEQTVAAYKADGRF